MIEPNVLGGISLTPRLTPTLHLFIDTSLQGLGAHLQGQKAFGLLSGTQRTFHINKLEVEVLILAISHWQERLWNTQLAISTNNSAMVWCLRNQGKTHSHSLLQQTFRFFHPVD